MNADASDIAGFAQYIDGKYGLVGLIAIGLFGIILWRMFRDDPGGGPKDAGKAVETIAEKINDLHTTQVGRSEKISDIERQITEIRVKVDTLWGDYTDNHDR